MMRKIYFKKDGAYRNWPLELVSFRSSAYTLPTGDELATSQVAVYKSYTLQSFDEKSPDYLCWFVLVSSNNGETTWKEIIRDKYHQKFSFHIHHLLYEFWFSFICYRRVSRRRSSREAAGRLISNEPLDCRPFPSYLFFFVYSSFSRHFLSVSSFILPFSFVLLLSDPCFVINVENPIGTRAFTVWFLLRARLSFRTIILKTRLINLICIRMG